jgi:dimethylargininase
MSNYGVHDMVSPLRRVMMKQPGPTLANADPAQWHYSGPLTLEHLQNNHQTLIECIRASGTEIMYLVDTSDALADSIFTYDPSLVTPHGAIILRMGKQLRRGEECLHASFYLDHNIPILGSIKAPGTVEAGDCVWLDEHTLVVGLGFRTNEDGVTQLQEIVADIDVQIQAFDLPVFSGRDACLHLMSVISMLDHDLALIYRPLFPVRLQQLLEQRGIECLPAPEDEFISSGGLSLNVLTLAPRKCVMIDSFPETLGLLQAAGCSVLTFPGDELCLKTEGGPTCLTRPLLRRE